MRPTLYSVRDVLAGRISTMAKPRGGDWLQDEMQALRAHGVDVLVCALTAGEVAELGLEEEKHAAQAAGLHFLSLPIPDRGVPAHQTAEPVIAELLGHLRRGEHVVAHCRFGIGRASLVAAALLVAGGVPAEEAWDIIGHARGVPVPDTPAQSQWVTEFQARTLRP